MADKAQVQQLLLKKIKDRGKMQRLLQSENLLYLLKRYGYQKATLQQRVKNGTLTGELLLELLEKEPDPDQLLALLNNNVVAVEKPLKAPSVRPAPSPVPDVSTNTARSKPASPSPFSLLTTPTAPYDEGGKLFERPLMRRAVVIVMLTAVFPALMHTGFFSGINVIPSPAIAMIITVIGGAIAGVLFSHTTANAPWKGILIGIALNVGVLLTTIVYSQSRIKLYSVEILIPLVLGSLPGMFLYLVLIWRKAN